MNLYWQNSKYFIILRVREKRRMLQTSPSCDKSEHWICSWARKHDRSNASWILVCLSVTLNPEDDFNTGQMPLSQCHRSPKPTGVWYSGQLAHHNTHQNVNFYHFHIVFSGHQMWGDSRFSLADGYLTMTACKSSNRPIKSKVNSPLKNAHRPSLRNAGLETSSGFIPCYS